MNIFGKRGQSKVITEHDHLSIFDKRNVFCGLPPFQPPKMLNDPGEGTIVVLSILADANQSGAVSRASGDKGPRIEREIVARHVELGVKIERVPPRAIGAMGRH